MRFSRSNRLAIFVAPSKFEGTIAQSRALAAIQEGEELEKKLEGRRILPDLTTRYAPSVRLSI